MTNLHSPAQSNTPAILTVIVPCFNEEVVLPVTAEALAGLLSRLVTEAKINAKSKIIFVDDGSTDGTWPQIRTLTENDPLFGGIKLSRNRGHQNALLCGLLNVGGDAIVSIDADLQDDINAIEEMLHAYSAGADIVYGVRAHRKSDTLFKRASAWLYYRFLRSLGVNAVLDHADFRLMSRRAVEALRQYGEVNLFLRGIVPQLGFKTRIVPYDRKVRAAGTSKYPLPKMLALALEGVTSFSIRPLRWITVGGILLSLISFLFGLWAVGVRLAGGTYVPGWASTVIPLYFLGGIQMLSLGIVGEYLGKVYLETKHRPRFIIEQAVGCVCRQTHELK